jgi:hypothetical protein
MRIKEKYSDLSTTMLKMRLEQLVSQSDDLKRRFEWGSGPRAINERRLVETKIAMASIELKRRGYKVDIIRKQVDYKKYKSDVEITKLKKKAESPQVVMPKYIRALPPHKPVRKVITRMVKPRAVTRGLQEKVLTTKQIETLRKSGSVDITINGIKKRITKRNVPLRKRMVYWYPSGGKVSVKVMR